MSKNEKTKVWGIVEILLGVFMVIVAASASSALKEVYAKDDAALLGQTLADYQKSVASFKQVYLQMNQAVPELEKSLEVTRSVVQYLNGPADMLLNVTLWKVPLTSVCPFGQYQENMQAFKDALPRLDAAFANAIGSLQRYQRETTPATIASLDKTLAILEKSREKVNTQNAINHRFASLLLLFGIVLGAYMAGNGIYKLKNNAEK